MVKMAFMFVIICFLQAKDGTLLVNENFNLKELQAPKALISAISRHDDGNGGKCISLDTSKIYFPLIDYFRYKSGSIEFRINYQEEPQALNDTSLVLLKASGNYKKKYPDSYLNSFSLIQGWKAGLFLLFGDSEKRYTIRCTEAQKWKKNEWHHMAITWNIANDGQAEIILFADGVPSGKINSPVKIDEESWQAVNSYEGDKINYCLAIGNFYGKVIPVLLDDLKIWDFPRLYQ
ncbi:MAG: hypothetical protein A2096_13280 [Spirochaetes bacterium GWF1_41_5]|nr:MAG: hypothetical protein A2096_13280 [Spirochaetes bacterium GWF1_41_5]HBE03861.1 hypothetical protein [Spirochaetia bacterium]